MLALIDRITKKEEATLAIDAVDRQAPSQSPLRHSAPAPAAVEIAWTQAVNAARFPADCRYRRDKASKGDFTGLGTYDTGRLISARPLLSHPRPRRRACTL